MSALKDLIAPYTPKSYIIGVLAEDEKCTVTVAQVAEVLRVAKVTVYRRLESGDYKGEKAGGIWEIPASQFPDSVREAFEKGGGERQPARPRKNTGSHPKISSEKQAAVVTARCRDGLTVKETAAKFGINRSTVQKITDRNPAPEPGPDDRIPAVEAAAILGVHPDTLRRNEQKLGLEIYRTPGRHRRYRRGQITAIAERHPG